MAPTFTANFTPSEVPFATASSTLAPIFSLLISILSLIFSFSGTRSFAATTAAGADITEAAKRCLANNTCSAGSSPPRNPMYAARTPPAIVAIPPVIKHIISLLVILSKYGLIRNGDSVCPRKMLPAAARLSAPESRMVFFMIHANT